MFRRNIECFHKQKIGIHSMWQHTTNKKSLPTRFIISFNTLFGAKCNCTFPCHFDFSHAPNISRSRRWPLGASNFTNLPQQQQQQWKKKLQFLVILFANIIKVKTIWDVVCEFVNHFNNISALHRLYLVGCTLSFAPHTPYIVASI